MVGSHRLLLALALCCTAAVATAAPLRNAAAARVAPQIRVVGHLTPYLASQLVNPDRDAIGYRLTLRITGSHFGPGSTVSLTVVKTSPWAVLARGSTRARPEGTIAYQMRLNAAPSPARLAVLYRSAGDVGRQTVTLR